MRTQDGYHTRKMQHPEPVSALHIVSQVALPTKVVNPLSKKALSGRTTVFGTGHLKASSALCLGTFALSSVVQPSTTSWSVGNVTPACWSHHSLVSVIYFGTSPSLRLQNSSKHRYSEVVLNSLRHCRTLRESHGSVSLKVE